ncbi:hypothetical protein [Pontibacter pudoricolor]|uniref:hypothetical protein n=1 Tax=Pontibacter pudoricolor TaxID=2694930 RepID=UPI001391E520|nr:hypothetical protein [Pontibacter pudoricolor]
MNLRIKNSQITLKVIGWIQIIGGILGFWVMSKIMLYTETVSGGILLVILVGLGLFSFSIYAGRHLLSEKEVTYGIILSIINQALQTVHFSMFGNGLSYSSGLVSLIGIENGFKFNFAIFSSVFNMSYLLESYDFMLKINLVAIFLILILVDIWRERKHGLENQVLDYSSPDQL